MVRTAVGRPGEGEFAPYYQRYVALVPGEDIVALLATLVLSGGGISGDDTGFVFTGPTQNLDAATMLLDACKGKAGTHILPD